MREEFLHYLWKTKNIPLNNLILTDGRKIEINTFGLHNHDSGPDFSNASINIEGIKWIGNIEIHLKSSDWYAHKHQFDKAYDNVILHVVLEHDKDVIINKEIIPTLELKNVIPLSHFEQYAKILSNQKWIPCLDLFNSVESFHIENQVEFAAFQRLERKVESISKRFIELKHDLNQLIIENTAVILGTKVNRLPMIELTQAIPSTLYFKESKETQLALIYEIANVFPDNSEDRYVNELKIQGEFYRKKHRLFQLNPTSWKYFGTRAPGFPPFRLAQFSVLLSNPKFFDFLVIPIEEWITWFYHEKFTLDNYWQTHYHFNVSTKSHKAQISKNTKELILINVIAPIMYWWGVHQKKEHLTENAFQLLEMCSSETNIRISNWKKMGLNPISAKDSQGLLELKNEFCNKKKCLSCKIGHQLFKQ
jgi:regulator of replication initiation timing